VSKNYKLISDPHIIAHIKNYPGEPAGKLLDLRELILRVTGRIEGLGSLEETFKWGEPSYLTKYGSTIRIDWKEKKPDQYGMYFKCTSKLPPTFKVVYGNVF